jgi:tRNA threonylcarbamoyl adenosine modification protein YeaZ
MRTLAIDCATEMCSVALFDGATLIAEDSALLGRGHAEALVPMIAALPNRGKAQRIMVARGPGSFTGVRIGIAAAKALQLAWGAELLTYATPALIAAQALALHDGPVDVAMTGGHGEWFVASFDADGSALGDIAALTPDAAAAASRAPLVAGTQAEALVARRRSGTALTLHPLARDVMRLRGAQLGTDLAPLYGRAPDARLPA